MSAQRDHKFHRLLEQVEKLKKLTDVIAEAVLDGDVASLREWAEHHARLARFRDHAYQSGVHTEALVGRRLHVRGDLRTGQILKLEVKHADYQLYHR